MCLAIIACFSLVCAAACGFNLDTDFPVVYSGYPGDYFGYTVALHRNSEGPIALFGAPRANSSILRDKVHQPGGLFKCNIPVNGLLLKCAEVILDDKENTRTDRGKEYSYYEKKDNMWLGVSLDVQQDTPNNHIVTCGHLWKNQNYRSHYMPNGICYVIDSDLDERNVIKLLPLIQRSKQAIVPPGIYYFAMAQAGTSATFSEDGKHLILGAPGIYDWTGSLVSYSFNTSNPRDDYSSPSTPDPPAGLKDDSYLGYSVTTGKFFDNNDMFYAVGAPRDNFAHGRVYIFKSLENTRNKLRVQQKIQGTQLGEYFGGSVLGINLNGDNFTDLLVGAPFYSMDFGGDEGKVYVYISNGVGLQSYAELVGNSKPNSRFGTAIANVGDLNQDGFNDVAVGAPYEEGRGAVYIYHGSNQGLNSRYAQKIAASAIDGRLSGFGIHISRGLDVDDNGYPDILVGSYASSQAVLFRSRPVITVHSRIIFEPKQINMNVTCGNSLVNLPCVLINCCLLYTGDHVLPVLEFQTSIQIEGFDSRAFLEGTSQDLHSTVNMEVSIGKEECFPITMFLRKEIRDIITPIQVLFYHELKPAPGSKSVFDKTLPVYHSDSMKFVMTEIPFKHDCASTVCLSNLKVSARRLDPPESVEFIILGTVSSVSVEISIVNDGESAYLSELLIYVPEEMSIINQDICEGGGQEQNASLICDIGNPLRYKDEATIRIKLDVIKIPTYTEYLVIDFEVVTLSSEKDHADNTAILPLFFKPDYETDVKVISPTDQVISDGDKMAKSDNLCEETPPAKIVEFRIIFMGFGVGAFLLSIIMIVLANLDFFVRKDRGILNRMLPKTKKWKRKGDKLSDEEFDKLWDNEIVKTLPMMSF